MTGIKKTSFVRWFKSHLYFAPTLIYLPALFNFFSGDDWFHLRISQIHSISAFFNFFSFSQTAQSATFYRPLSTQTFFFIFQTVFGLNSWPYFFFVLICFAYSLFLVYRFALHLFNNKNKALLTSFVYGVSVSNFTRIYFLSAFQEIALVIFSLLCLLSFDKSKTKAFVFFICALLSKETAIVLPLVLLVFNYKDIKKWFYRFAPFIYFSIFYLFMRFGFFGLAQGDSYIWNFSPIKALNTLAWYGLWSLGAPELLVDYIGHGFRPIPRFFTDFPLWWPVIIGLVSSTVVLLAILFTKKLKNLNFDFIKYLLLFLLPLFPVIFLPQHKFPLELGLPLVGFSLLVAYLLPVKKTMLSIMFLVVYFFLNLSMNYLTHTRHYALSRGEISLSVFKYLVRNYQIYPSGQYFEFVNDAGDFGPYWGQSKQISQALSGSDFFKVYYINPNVEAFYQDIPGKRPANLKPLYLSTKQFLSP